MKRFFIATLVLFLLITPAFGSYADEDYPPQIPEESDDPEEVEVLEEIEEEPEEVEQDIPEDIPTGSPTTTDEHNQPQVLGQLAQTGVSTFALVLLALFLLTIGGAVLYIGKRASIG